MSKQGAGKPQISREEALAFLKRWEAAGELERAELQRMSAEQKFQLLGLLMASAQLFGWRDRLREGEQEVRDRWKRLKDAYGV